MDERCSSLRLRRRRCIEQTSTDEQREPAFSGGKRQAGNREGENDMNLEKTYNPQSIEGKIYDRWLEK
ncbi:MAG: hypothetical protein IJR36_03420, partial [Lachnospiraceae bacterium]|nr:hypothetical protein [Lachnospiraceae bacterium]